MRLSDLYTLRDEVFRMKMAESGKFKKNNDHKACEQGGQRAKRLKMQDMEPIFQTFLSHRKKKELDLALRALDSGLSDLTFGVLFVKSSNAHDTVSFKDISLRTSILSLDEGAKVAKGAAAGDVFLTGVDVLQNYLDKNQPKIPENVFHLKALQKLLSFLNSSEGRTLTSITRKTRHINNQGCSHKIWV